MGKIKVKWNNLAVANSLNATGQIVYKRLKAVGGGFDSLNISPVNPMAKTVSEAIATVTENRIYEFRVEALCTFGGPIQNDNGIMEGISFGCIAPSFSVTSTSGKLLLGLIDTDITKARVKLRKADDMSLLASGLFTRTADTIEVEFTELQPSTDYYVEIELYATVQGVERISSSIDHLGDACGGNTEGYTFTTAAPPACPIPSNLQVIY